MYKNILSISVSTLVITSELQTVIILKCAKDGLVNVLDHQVCPSRDILSKPTYLICQTRSQASATCELRLFEGNCLGSVTIFCFNGLNGEGQQWCWELYFGMSLLKYSWEYFNKYNSIRINISDVVH